MTYRKTGHLTKTQVKSYIVTSKLYFAITKNNHFKYRVHDKLTHKKRSRFKPFRMTFSSSNERKLRSSSLKDNKVTFLIIIVTFFHQHVTSLYGDMISSGYPSSSSFKGSSPDTFLNTAEKTACYMCLDYI